MKSLSLLLSPADVSLFRDPRPFQFGDTSVSSTLPLPQVMAGAIRSWLLNAYGIRIGDHYQAGETADLRVQRLCPVGHPARWVVDMQLTGPFLSEVSGKPFLPAPAHMMGKADKGSFVPKGLQQPLKGALPGWKSPVSGLNLVPAWFLPPVDETLEPTDGYLEKTTMGAVLRGQVPSSNAVVTRSKLFDYESRLGIGMDSERNSSAEGQIYSAAFLRLNKGVCFRVDIQIVPGAETEFNRILSEYPWIILGGERKTACLKCVPLSAWPSPKTSWQADGEMLFTTYLATPGLFSQGKWLPEQLQSKGLQLVSAVVGKPLPWSPWDTARRQHGITRYAVPAGAIYFWRKPADVQLDDPHGTCISDSKEDRLAGWGFCLRGEWNYV